eukprot:GFKZ01015293.1.p1 GENE.GFKZ01015293.1~~GFKZ01015293.1.p1  ORF type:complete len:236 (+),score=43.02 GFKZ01015293.1:209-916(+)
MFRTFPRLPRVLSAHKSASQFCTAANARLTYLPHKVKEEMAALHEEDSKRWNASTLSARYTAPRENVETWLRLVKVRQSKEKAEGEEVTRLREQVAEAWGRLRESSEKRRVIRAKPTSKEERNVADESADESTEMEAKMEAEVEAEMEETIEEHKVELGKTRTAEWVEKVCEMGVRDVKRKTTFAFVEVGKEVSEGLDGAVWIREGSTGKLRVAVDRERDVLLGKKRSQDPSIWN